METDFVIMVALVSSGKPASKEVEYRNMYAFVCCLAAQHITANYQRTKSKDYWLLLQLNFGGAIANYPSKIDAKERVLQSFGGNWPAGFVEYCTEKHNQAISTKKAFCNVKDEDIRLVYIGSIIDECSSKTKAYINNKINPMYEEEPPSGYSTLSLLSAIRDYL